MLGLYVFETDQIVIAKSIGSCEQKYDLKVEENGLCSSKLCCAVKGCGRGRGGGENCWAPQHDRESFTVPFQIWLCTHWTSFWRAASSRILDVEKLGAWMVVTGCLLECGHLLECGKVPVSFLDVSLYMIKAVKIRCGARKTTQVLQIHRNQGYCLSRAWIWQVHKRSWVDLRRVNNALRKWSMRLTEVWLVRSVEFWAEHGSCK